MNFVCNQFIPQEGTIYCPTYDEMNNAKENKGCGEEYFPEDFYSDDSMPYPYKCGEDGLCPSCSPQEEDKKYDNHTLFSNNSSLSSKESEDKDPDENVVLAKRFNSDSGSDFILSEFLMGPNYGFLPKERVKEFIRFVKEEFKEVEDSVDYDEYDLSDKKEEWKRGFRRAMLLVKSSIDIFKFHRDKLAGEING